MVSMTLSRYFSKVFLTRFAVTLLGVLALISLLEITELLRRAATRPDIDFQIILEMTGLKLLDLAQQVLPYTVLFSAMGAFWKLNRHQELSMTRLTGASVWHILVPFVLTAFAIGFVVVTLLTPLSAAMMERYEHLNARYFQGQMGNVMISDSGIWVRQANEEGNSVFRVGRVDIDSNKMQDVMILQYQGKEQIQTRLDAKKATFATGGFLLEDVWITEAHQTPQHKEKLFFDSNLSLAQLKESNASPEMLSFWSLPGFIDLLEKSGLAGVKYRLQWHSLIAHAFWLATMVVLAGAFSMRPLRRGGALVLLSAGAACGFFLFFVKDVTYAMAGSGTLPILLAVWTPIGISGMLAVTTLLYLEDH